MATFRHRPRGRIDEDAPLAIARCIRTFSAGPHQSQACIHHYGQNALQKGTRCAGSIMKTEQKVLLQGNASQQRPGRPQRITAKPATQNGVSSFNSKAEGAQQGEGTAHIVGARSAWCGWSKFHILRPMTRGARAGKLHSVAPAANSSAIRALASSPLTLRAFQAAIPPGEVQTVLAGLAYVRSSRL
jgi:hypothetical protein